MQILAKFARILKTEKISWKLTTSHLQLSWTTKLKDWATGDFLSPKVRKPNLIYLDIIIIEDNNLLSPGLPNDSVKSLSESD